MSTHIALGCPLAFYHAHHCLIYKFHSILSSQYSFCFATNASHELGGAICSSTDHALVTGEFYKILGYTNQSALCLKPQLTSNSYFLVQNCFNVFHGSSPIELHGSSGIV